MNQFRFLIAVPLFLVSMTSIASAGLVVKMTGTLGIDATLNGESVADQPFTMRARVQNESSFYLDPLSQFSFWEAHSGVMEIGSQGQFEFVFSNEDLYFYQSYATDGNDTPYNDFGFAQLEFESLNPLTISSGSTFYYRDYDPNAPINPASLQAPFFYDTFDFGGAIDYPQGPSVFTNGENEFFLGERLALQGASVTVVPEPGTIGLLASVGFVLLFNRRRHLPAEKRD